MAQPIKEEIASVQSDPYVPLFSKTLEPADDTVRVRGGGKGVGLYDEIRRDGHAFAVLQKRKLEVISREWQVMPASDRLKDKKAAELVEAQLKGFAFDRVCRGLMGAVLKGFAVGEVIWELRGGIWTAANIKVRKQRRFRFTPEGGLRLITRESGSDGIELPPRKFIVHRHSIDDDDDDPYGLGLGTVLFWPAWFKRQVLSHWLQASERFAEPSVLATYGGAYDEERQKQLLDAIRQMGRNRGLAVPDSVVVTLLEATRGGGGDGHEKLSRYLDEMMSEAVLGETLSTNSGERGARSLGEIHNEVRIAIAKADSDLISATLNETLVKWIVEINLPGSAPPSVWRDFSEAEDLDARATRDKTIVDMGFKPASADYINETYGGDWIEKAPEPSPTVSAQPGHPGAKAALDALFADKTPAPDPAAELADQLDTLAQPIVDAMLSEIRAAFADATSYDDLAERLLSLGLSPDKFGALLEQATIAADLTGRAEVADGN